MRGMVRKKDVYVVWGSVRGSDCVKHRKASTAREIAKQDRNRFKGKSGYSDVKVYKIPREDIDRAFSATGCPRATYMERKRPI